MQCVQVGGCVAFLLGDPDGNCQGRANVAEFVPCDAATALFASGNDATQLRFA